MSDQTTVPLFDPQGVLRDVPYEQMRDALKAGGKPAVRFQAPDNSIRYVPADMTQDAVKAGGKLLPITQQAHGIPEAYGFTPEHLLSNAWEGVKGAAQGAYALGKDLVTNPNWVQGDQSTLHKFVEAPMEQQTQKAAQEMADPNGSKIKAAGHILASAVPLVGPWAADIGEQAGTGDVGGALAKTAGQVGAPVLASKAISGAVNSVKPAAQVVAEHMYQSTLKPSTAKFAPDAATVVRTGLDNAIPISRGGLDKLGDLIDDYNTKIADQIKAGAKSGQTINKFDVASRLGKTAKQFQTQVNPEADLQAISNAGNEFIRNQPGQIPVDEAQALKQGTYKQLKGRAYGELGSATIESQKALARGIKEELQTQFPEIKNLNAQEAKLIDLDGALEKAVNRIGNHQLIGIGTSVAGAAGGVAGGLQGMGIAAIMKTIIDNPTVKSKLAIALSRGARGGGQVGSVSPRLAAYSSALGNAATSQESDDQKSQQ